MLGSIWNFVKRHRRKFIVTGAIVGGAVLLGKYAQRKISEIQERETTNCLAHARKQHHFDSNQRTCNTTVLSMLPALREALLNAIDTESLTSQLKTKPANKLEIWEDLKILSFTRTVVAVYCSCMMVVMLRVQLNIMGGYIYLDNISNKNSSDDVVATATVQKEYYAVVQYLLSEGLVDLIRGVKSAVEKVIGSISFKQQMRLLDIQDIINKVRLDIEQNQENPCERSGQISNLTNYLLPPGNLGSQAARQTLEDMTMDQLMIETRDMLDSSDFHLVLGTCLDVSFTRLLDKLAEYFKPVTENEEASFSLNAVCMPMAKVIPIMNGMVHSICGDTPNQFIQELLLKEQVRDFAANVYEAFSQPTTKLHP